MQWIAERFFSAGQAWVDAASGHAVRLRLSEASDDDIAWSEGCATLSNLRHPLLNPMLDYGIGPNGYRFEAYERGDPVSVGPAGVFGERLLEHVTQFLRASSVDLPPDRAAVALRPIVGGRAALRRPIGLRLQRRRALEVVEEFLDVFSPPGPATVRVTAGNNAGLRTFRTLVARTARLRGFVPLGPPTIRRCPRLVDHLRERHVCVLDDLEDRSRSAALVSWLISTLSISSARRHVVVRLERGSCCGIPLEALSVRTLLGMVHTGGPADPDQQELMAAARAADGLPGLFVARLCGGYSIASRSMVVHETSPAYDADRELAAALAPIGGRVLGAALRAQRRATLLAASGRHAVAVRVLNRGIRVLQGRERGGEAARCALDLGWLWLDRGRPQLARASFESAHRLAGESPEGIRANVGIGVALTDERRSVEAEAVLRGALAAAETLNDSETRLAAAAALTRCLLWQDRCEEAVALAAVHHDQGTNTAHGVRLRAVLARAQVRLGRVAAGVRTAREAQRAAASAGAHAQAAAELALAEALEAAGDGEGRRAAVARAVRLARANHLPLVRVRAALIGSHPTSGRPGRVVERLRKLSLPPLLADRLERSLRPVPPRLEPVAELETFLVLSQRSTDDAGAGAEICKAVAQRTGASAVAIFCAGDRTVAVHGRGWSSVPIAAKEAMAHGASVVPDPALEPREHAEAVRYGGEIIGAIACRWLAGGTIDHEGVAVVLRAAALSVAPHVRALLDHRAAAPSGSWGDLLGESTGAAALRDDITRVARAPFPVLVEGESGSGKELVARAVHRLSARRGRRFCALNCAALTDDLVESELFGHARGAFTGAATERAGLFEEADGGTLFLDEVGELSARAQAKLLRVVQEGEMRRVGENFSRHVDVRVIAATNRRLEDEVAAGRFRADLRFRLDVVRITVPPLRDRATDIPLLASHFWREASARVGSRATLSPEALAALARYDWPGNVRELQNVIAWIAVQSPRRGRIGPSALPRHVAQAAMPAPCSFEAAREEFERRFVRAALAGANGQRARAAATLGVTRQGLAKMMRRLGIQ